MRLGSVVVAVLAACGRTEPRGWPRGDLAAPPPATCESDAADCAAERGGSCACVLTSCGTTATKGCETRGRWSPLRVDSCTWLRDVWGAAPDDVWAVGGGGAIVHFDGACWSRFDSDSSDVLVGVHGTGPADVWAIGANRVVLHWDGRRWSVQRTLPEADLGHATLTDVRAFSERDVWVTANPNYFLHFDGDRWSKVVSVPREPVLGGLALYGSGPADLWVVKHFGEALHFDGTAWANVTTGDDSAHLYAVDGTGPTHVWVAGTRGVLRRFDGSSWAEAPNQVPGRISGLSFAGDDSGWAVGDMGYVEHWDGERWSPPRPMDGIDFGGSDAVWSADRNEAWAVGMFWAGGRSWHIAHYVR